MLIDVKAKQHQKAYPPIEVALSGMLTDVKEVQYSYLQPVITQYFASNKSEIWS